MQKKTMASITPIRKNKIGDTLPKLNLPCPLLGKEGIKGRYPSLAMRGKNLQ
jgi:hypothetical protein